MKRVLMLVAAALAVAGFLVAPFLVVQAPLAYDLHLNQKIFYYHVPAAWVMFLSVFVCGVASVGYLVNRKPSWDDVASGAGDLVVLFGAIVMTTGPIWGKAAWGAYWVWEARLTTSLLLWMIFIAYAILRRYGGLGSERLGAGLAVFGMVDVPLVYFAVNFWKTQHPGNRVVGGLPGTMLGTFLIAMATFTVFYVILLAAHVSIGRGERKLQAVTDLAVETGHLE